MMIEKTLDKAAHPYISIFMETNRSITLEAAVGALGALAQEHRLALFRLLVQAGEEGLPAGRIAASLGLPNSSLSFHLAQLSRAGLIAQERRGRSLIYRADFSAMDALVGYLMENCCAGARCAPTGACGDAASNDHPERNCE